MISLKQLEVLHAVVLSGSITKAQKSLGLAQPTISQQLAKMEDKLGTLLLRRERSQGIELTLAGEYWYRTAKDIIGRMEAAETNHNYRFSKMKLDLRFGTTPVLRRLLIQEVADISVSIKEFSNAEFVWALTSNDVVEMINSHRINCGVVSEASVGPFTSSLYIKHLFDDEIVWVVPNAVPENVITNVLMEKMNFDGNYPALNRYVDVRSGIPWHCFSQNWYRSELPTAAPYFSCMTHQAAVDIVAGGNATCHAPVSLLPNLPAEVISKINFYHVPIYTRRAVLVMPKHLLTLRPFVEFSNKLTEYFHHTYLSQIRISKLSSYDFNDRLYYRKSTKA